MAEVNHKQYFANGHTNWAVDAAQLAQQSHQSLDQLLAEQTGLFIRNYGPSGLSLVSLRGTAAQHTTLLWQGIPLNSPMNGVIDASLLPGFLFDQITAQPGGSTAIWGSGAIGGSIQLQTNLPTSATPQIKLTQAIGSWGDQRYGMAVGGNYKKLSLQTKLWHQQANNNYWITNGSDTYRQPHGQVQQLGFLQSAAWTTQRSHLAFHIWHQQADRSLPPAVGASWNGSTQQDNYWRMVGNYNHHLSPSLTAQGKVAYLREAFTYDDNFQTNASESIAQTAWSEWTITRTTGRHFFWQGGLHGQQVWASAPGYTATTTQAQGAAFFSTQYVRNRWQAGANLRAGIADGFRVPPVGTLWARWEINQWLTIKGQLAKDYRIPTLNDRFWSPGGNPGLLPETSLGQDAGIIIQQENKFGDWRYTATGYHRLVDEWIIWLPLDNIWTPENVQQVRAQGWEQMMQWLLRRESWSTGIQIRHDYVRATPTKTATPNDPVVGKQLIYTPKHQLTIRPHIQWHNFRLTYLHRYTSQRYTTSTNTHALPGFHLGTWLLAYQGRWQELTWQLQGSIDNCWNVPYDIFMGRRMPGRSYQIQVTLSR